MRAWAESDDLWLRRSSIISQLTFAERTDTALLLECIEPNLADRSFWIRKAIGWALRQYARTDPQWVRATVAGFGDRMSGLSRREATKHL
jgi:3-methyladenine DNA glycosylase AlkD